MNSGDLSKAGGFWDSQWFMEQSVEAAFIGIPRDVKVDKVGVCEETEKEKSTMGA